MNMSSSSSLGKYSCTPAAPRMRRPPPSRATMSCTKTRKRARSFTSAHSAPLRYALRYALRCTLRCALRVRAALRSHSATQRSLVHAIDFVLPPPHYPQPCE